MSTKEESAFLCFDYRLFPTEGPLYLLDGAKTVCSKDFVPCCTGMLCLQVRENGMRPFEAYPH